MKAIVQKSYGSPDALQLREVEAPAAGDGGVLVEVHAASVNALDWHLVRGVPVFIPIFEATAAPRHRVRGVDLAGRVSAVGKNVTRFTPGDEVLGGADGSFAEFTVTTEKRLAPKPAGITRSSITTPRTSPAEASAGTSSSTSAGTGRSAAADASLDRTVSSSPSAGRRGDGSRRRSDCSRR